MTADQFFIIVLIAVGAVSLGINLLLVTQLNSATCQRDSATRNEQWEADRRRDYGKLLDKRNQRLSELKALATKGLDD